MPHSFSQLTTQRRLPAEYEPQRAILLTWPHAQGDFGSQLAEVETTFLALAYHISRSTALIISCLDNDNLHHIQHQLSMNKVNIKNCHLYVVPSNDIWARDHGPITIFEKNYPKLLNFQFNGWGEKHKNQLDNQLTSKLEKKHAFFGYSVQRIDFILEGGSIESDGQGTILTTSRCLLHPKRNKQYNKKQITQKLIQYFGANRILWLGTGGLEGDDTDGHIDMLARFGRTDIILYTACNDTSNPNYDVLKAMKLELMTLRTKQGSPYHLLPLPIPKPMFYTKGKMIPATYTNFLIVNDQVLVPQFNDPNDTIALSQLQYCFPKKTIIGINCQVLMTQFGGIHCATMGIF